MDFEKARYYMIEQQIRPWDVLDDRVLDAMRSLPREQFTPKQYQSIAYVDTRVPLCEYEGHTITMLNPNIQGRILQALQLNKNDVVLEIGTGSGYLTACMARLARHVDSVEICPELVELAEDNLEAQGIENVTITEGDASHDWDQQKQYYDAIAITAAMPEIPEKYKKRLTIGGRLFVVTGEAPAMHAWLITRTSKTTWETKELFETVIDYMIRNELEPEFVF